MTPAQLIAQGQLTDPEVNFATVHRLTSACNCSHEFSLPHGNFDIWVTRCTTPGNQPCRGHFSPCEQNAKVARGKSSLAYTHY